jgi:5-oxoprolinase (ATP-hydrolysing)
MADLEAQIAANETGIAALRDAMIEFGPTRCWPICPCAGQCRGQRAARLGAEGQHVHLPLDDIGADQGADPRRPRQREGPRSTSPAPRRSRTATTTRPCRSADGGGALCLPHLVGRDIPLNEGCLKPLKLIVPEGCMINPAPAAVIAGNTEVSQAITECAVTARWA